MSIDSLFHASRDYTPSDFKAAATRLFDLLDDIDTLDDACRDDDRLFRDRVRKIQMKRFAVAIPRDDGALDFMGIDGGKG